MKYIGQLTRHLPTEAPVMVLPEAQLFPNALVPLHIFEPRYREMLRQVLDGERMFCLAMLRAGRSEPEQSGDFHHMVGLGLTRVCVAAEDGTSNLVLQGMTRVRLLNFVQARPFWIAEIRELHSHRADDPAVPDLTEELIALCRDQAFDNGKSSDTFEQTLAQATDPSLFSDIVGHTFLRDPLQRQQLLEELDVVARLRLLIRYLEGEKS